MLPTVVCFLHNRYRSPGGEEQVVAALRRLAGEQLGLPTALLEVRSAKLGRGRAALSLLGGGLYGRRLRTLARSGPLVVHAHNLVPAFGPRPLEAAKKEGAAVILHLHQFRLVCAIGVCFREGAPCTRCHGRNTLPGIRYRCRGSLPEALLYGYALARNQRPLLALADRVVVPSAFTANQLRRLGVPLRRDRLAVVPPPLYSIASRPAEGGRGALLAARLAPEKGVEVGLAACARAGVPVAVAGEGPLRPRLEAVARRLGADATFYGYLPPPALAALRSRCALALVPSYVENFPTAAAEALGAGLPVAATAVGGTAELLPERWLAPPGDSDRLAAVIEDLQNDKAAGEEALSLARRRLSPTVVAPLLGRLYGELGLPVKPSPYT